MPATRSFSGTPHPLSCDGFIIIRIIIEDWLKYIFLYNRCRWGTGR
jgi:hypothetical protein